MMLKLFKYEAIKNRLSKLLVAAITLVLEALFCYGVFKEDNKFITITSLVLFLLATFSIVWFGIQSVVTLHKDLNSRQAYMLFMTPNSNYKILGAKVLENAVSVLLCGVFFGLLGFIDYTLIRNNVQALDEMIEMMNTIFSELVANIRLDPMAIIAFGSYMIFNWLSTITVAYLAVIMVSSVLKEKKGSMLIAFLIFLALNALFNLLFGLVPETVDSTTANLLRSAISVVIIVITYYFSALIMEKKLSV